MILLHPGLEALQDGFVMLDSEWRIEYWNGAAERLFDRKREPLLRQDLWDELPELRDSPLWELLHLVAEDGTSREILLSPGKGRARCLAVRATRVEEGGGLAVQLRDATDQFELTERHTRLLESIQDGFLAVDSGWKVVYVNGVAETLLHLPRRRAIGAPLWSLLPAQPAAIADSLRATMNDRAPRHLERFQPRGRRFRGRHFDIWMYPLPGGGVSILFDDVTERVQRERDLARYAGEIEDANRVKSRFFAAVSHELRTPLNAIIGYLYLLSSGTYGPLSRGAKRAADRAGVCADHLSRLVDDVLLLTTTEIGRLPVAPSIITPRTFIAEAVEPLRVQAEAKGLRFVVEVHPDTPPITTDPDRLRQVLLAILSNAVKFTPTGDIRVEVRAANGDTIRPHGVAAPIGAGPYVDLIVSDTGPGIPRRDRERVFAPFEQLGDPSRSDSMSRGTGLGLTVARRITTALHGALWVDEQSAAHPGATFRLRLPVEFEPETAANGGERREEDPS